MCGRFDIHSAVEIIARIFQVDSITFDIVPNYNAAPSQNIPIVMNDGKHNILVPSRWGFLPSWAKGKKTVYPMINARAETVDSNRSYREAFLNHRCLVIADGFYEWQVRDKIKTPFYIRLKTGQPMAFAGLYSSWTSPDGGEIRTSTIVTTEADELVAPLHDRMPAILDPRNFEPWVNPAEHDKDMLKSLLKPFPPEELEAYEVSSRVNSVKNNRPDNIEPLP